VRGEDQPQVQERWGATAREYVLRSSSRPSRRSGRDRREPRRLDDFREKITTAKMPGETEKGRSAAGTAQGHCQHRRLSTTVTRTYLEWLVELPGYFDRGQLDIPAARDILNADHYDLGRSKKRILEYLAVRKLDRQEGARSLSGGPAWAWARRRWKSIARALGRKFMRVSRGGVSRRGRDPRSPPHLVGSLPGRIVQGMKKADRTTRCSCWTRRQAGA